MGCALDWLNLLVLQVIDLVEDEHFFWVTMFMKTTLKIYIDLAFGASH
jgi:hypothetical protein